MQSIDRSKGKKKKFPTKNKQLLLIRRATDWHSVNYFCSNGLTLGL